MQRTVSRGGLQGRLLRASAAHRAGVWDDPVVDVGVVVPGLLIDPKHCRSRQGMPKMACKLACVLQSRQHVQGFCWPLRSRVAAVAGCPLESVMPSRTYE